MVEHVSKLIVRHHLPKALKEVWVDGKTKTFVLRDGPFSLRIKAINGVLEQHAEKKIEAAIVKPRAEKERRDAEEENGRKCNHFRTLIRSEMGAMRFLSLVNIETACSDSLDRLTRDPNNIVLHEMEWEDLKTILQQGRLSVQPLCYSSNCI